MLAPIKLPIEAGVSVQEYMSALVVTPAIDIELLGHIVKVLGIPVTIAGVVFTVCMLTDIGSDTSKHKVFGSVTTTE